MNLKKLIEKRNLKRKDGRVYIKSRKLNESSFVPGVKYKYIFDTIKKAMRIVPISEGEQVNISEKESVIEAIMTVSHTTANNYLYPVIDIKKSEVLDCFKTCENVEIEIFEDEILIRGYEKAEIEENESTKISSNKKIINFMNALELKREVLIKKAALNQLFLKKVSGGNSDLSGQLSIFDYLNTSSNHIVESAAAKTNISEEGKSTLKKDIPTALQVVSLFSGAGMLDKGFYDEGYELKFAMDIEKDMVDSYRLNLGDHVVHGDLSKYNISNIPDATVLIGGSPCQELSNSNRIGGKILDHPKNLLIRSFIKIAKSMKSLKVFVLENVPQLLTKGKKFVEEIKTELSDFEITINKVNSVDFGSAQVRERAIIIGSKIDKIELNPPTVRVVKTVRDAFKGLHDGIPNQLDQTKSSGDTLERIKCVPEGGNIKDIPEYLQVKCSHSNSYRRLSWNKPSITMVNVRAAKILHPVLDRILSVRECARLFDLPDNFLFTGTLANKQQMVVNGVPLALGSAIAKLIKEKFEIHYGVSFA